MGNAYFQIYKQTRNSSTNITKNPSFWLLFNLLISDFIASIYLFILVLSDIYYTGYYQEQYSFNTTFSLIKNEWSFSLTCYIELFLGKISIFVAATMTFLIGIDRFILIVYPHSNKKFSMKGVKIITAIVCNMGCILVSGTVTFTVTHAHYRSPYFYDFYTNI